MVGASVTIVLLAWAMGSSSALEHGPYAGLGAIPQHATVTADLRARSVEFGVWARAPTSPAETSAPDPVPQGDEARVFEDEGTELSLDDVFGGPSDEALRLAVDDDEPHRDPEPPGQASKQFETRFRVVSSAYYDVARVPERAFGRNENRLEFYGSFRPNKHVHIVADIEPVFFGVSAARELDDIATRQLVAPFHVESDAAYVALYDVVPNLDIKVGRQILVWGTADKFNPTNNINPDDLEDRPLFTVPIANQMVVVDYAPFDDRLWFEGVYVPLFYPALLPSSAAAAHKDPQAPTPFEDDADIAKITELQSLLRVEPRLVPTVRAHVRMPTYRFGNGQGAAKLGARLGDIDISVSYYYGRHDIPTPVQALASTKDPVDAGGEAAECCFASDVTLIYPRMQTVGADFATQISMLDNLGIWGEAALFIPEAHDLYIEFPVPVDVTPRDGMANPVRSMTGTTIRGTPFVKATGGLDYSLGKHVYLQVQYLRGFIDEFGSGHIGNYVVGGSELVFFGRHLLFRLFGVVDIQNRRGDRGSMVIAPEVTVVPPWGGVTFQAGSFVQVGGPRTKFGQSATGSSIVYGKVVGTF